MQFLLRSDPIVVRMPPTPPSDRHLGGQLDEWLRGLTMHGAQVLDPKTLSGTERTRLQSELATLFGTPSAPRMPNDALGLKSESLALGAKVYKDQCAVCHGTAGDGRGPTGAWVFPSPRDFRQSQMKFISVAGGTGQPCRDDIQRNLRLGVSGNSMPSFALLPAEKFEAVTDYTIFLSIRGTVERELLIGALGEDGPSGTANSISERVVNKWRDATAISVPSAPPSDSDRIARGAKLFETIGCLTCHKDYGREQHLLHDVWGTAVRPTNLTIGEYRGGKTSHDLFLRVRCGIPASGMPATNLPDDQVWDLVRFLEALPIPQQLPDAIRTQVYPQIVGSR